MPPTWFWFRTSTTSFSTNQRALQSRDRGADLVLSLADGQPAFLSEQLPFTNPTAKTVYLTLIECMDFTFSSGTDSVTISVNQATQASVQGSTETVSAPFDSRLKSHEAANYSTILAALTNASTSSSFNLNNQASANGNVETAVE